MAELPIMPVNVHLLLADTRHMTSEEFGAYCRILFTMWLHGGMIPNKPEQLARIAGVSLTRWRKMAEVVLGPMTETQDFLSQKRLTDTFLKVRELRAQRVVSAHKGWSRRKAYAVREH
jgi:uncharacterized protein YdaU (DUF1376 family)